MRDKVTHHLDVNKLNNTRLVRGRSCGTNLIEFLEKDKETFDTGEAFVMYLDFEKAFIKVLHERLQKKLIAHRKGRPFGMGKKPIVKQRAASDT